MRELSENHISVEGYFQSLELDYAGWNICEETK